MKHLHDALEYLRNNPALTSVVVWPILTAIITSLFGPRSTEQWDALKAKSQFRYNVAQFFSSWGIDVPQFVNLVKRVTSRGK